MERRAERTEELPPSVLRDLHVRFHTGAGKYWPLFLAFGSRLFRCAAAQKIAREVVVVLGWQVPGVQAPDFQVDVMT